MISALLLSALLQADPDHEPWQAPPLERCVSVRDGRTGAVLSFGELLDALARADVVFLGETHVDETTHRVELGVLDGLLARRDGVVLSLEMFERDVQATLDAYLAGEITEEAFLAAARPWGNYRTAYRPLIERAKQAGAPVVAANFPRPLLRKGMDGLEGAEIEQAPAELLPNTDEYWRRVDNAIRGHLGMMGAQTAESRLSSTQSLWDNAMGEACALALARHPGHVVLHVNGGFHTAYWDGTARQLALRAPDAKVLTVSIATAGSPASAEIGDVPVADYVVVAERRARDLNEGTYAVHVDRELEYRLHVPDGAESLPLLLWLPDDGLTAQEGLELCKQRLGDEAVIAVLEPTYRGIADDLAEGGRWFFADSFAEDVSFAIAAIERAWAYLLRYYPIDAERVCLAGEGTGATIVAATSLLTDRMQHRAVALYPRRFAKIKDFPLPLPELRGEWPDRFLSLFVRDADRDWWSDEISAYAEIDFETALTSGAVDPWTVEEASTSALRRSLGLPAAEEAEIERRHVRAPDDSARALFWARLVALRRGGSAVLAPGDDDEGSAEIPLAIEPADFAAGDRLPRCPGPFGGTTVVVVPSGATTEVLDAWHAIEDEDPINAASRFHRLRIAHGSGEHSLASVLAELSAAGRKNVLVVPAVFHASGAEMQALAREVRAFEDSMTVSFLPGLGGRLR